jgi:hypothetical protein
MGIAYAQQNRLRKEGEFLDEIGEKHPSGPEGPVDFVGFMRRLKPSPPSGSGFSAACKDRVDLKRLTARLKLCPDTLLG